MDKVYNSPWFVKVISFFVALMLFAMVNYDNVNNQPSVLPPITSGGSYTIEEVPLLVYYNEDEYAISEMTDSVKVNLRGPQNYLNLLKIERPSYEVFIDLRNLEAGTHTVNVQHRKFPNEVIVNIAPQTVRVTIEEKQTISLPVEIDLINKSEVKEGYTVGTPIVNPVNVEITAAESIIRHVALVKGFIDIKGATDTVEKSAPIKVYDQQGNELQIEVSPPVVDVKIPVTSPNKDVPVKIERVGELPEGLSIRTINTEPKEVTIFGPNDVINDISFMDGIKVNLSDVTGNMTYEVEVPIPDGVEKVSPQIIKVVVEVDIEETLEIEELPVNVIGLSERMEVAFVKPEEEMMTLVAKGSPNNIERLKKDEVQAYIDVSQLTVGEHLIPVQINGPQNVTYKKPYDEVKVIISEVLSIEDKDNSINETNEETT